MAYAPRNTHGTKSLPYIPPPEDEPLAYDPDTNGTWYVAIKAGWGEVLEYCFAPTFKTVLANAEAVRQQYPSYETYLSDPEYYTVTKGMRQ